MEQEQLRILTGEKRVHLVPGAAKLVDLVVVFIRSSGALSLKT